MRHRVIILGVLAAALVLGACGSSSKPQATPKSSTPVTYEPAGAFPSKSAKMVCEAEAQKDIAGALGMKTTRVTPPTWKDHVYSCTYVYPKGSFTLSVKELVSAKTTADFFNAQKEKLGSAQNLFGLGSGAFIAKNNDVVVWKDYKVLTVDMQKAPAGVGTFVPAMSRSDISTNIAAVIMGCWEGA